MVGVFVFLLNFSNKYKVCISHSYNCCKPFAEAYAQLFLALCKIRLTNEVYILGHILSMLESKKNIYFCFLLNISILNGIYWA